MNKCLPLITAGCFILLGSLSCRKAIEKKQQDIIMEAITNGVWMVEQFLEGSNNISNEFLYYEFQFFKNGTVTAVKGSATLSGTWSGDISNYSIVSQFPQAADPLKKLNGVWYIRDSYWDYVKAEMKTAAGINVLHLRKKT